MNATEESLFADALEKPPQERAAFLDAACAGDPILRKNVESLLSAYDAGQFLERPAASAAEPTIAEQPGTVLGPYKLVEQIGEGGMGTVWMAQQIEPVKRLVALKVIKPGMDSKQVLARFEAERQALALMDHPNIARVLDAGTTGGGRPFFVMELVKGMPLTKYCDEHRLTPRQRLELFVPVCQAVQHAHQKGIIHRDLKPSNVLVAQYDGQPVPKVIDFGIAKATGQQLTEHTLVTGFGTVVGTLEYMSPEQAELNQLDIDTRSDVYSLGVLVYELLTGTTPLERSVLRQAGLLEALRLVREAETPRPSTRLSTSDELPSVAANRGLDPKKLSGLVRGELDWIVMKALEKDRNRRYETANGFAQDVQRYLADEPVLACPPSAVYRFRKFVRRNRGRLVFAAGICVLVVAVLGSIGWAVRDRAMREEEKQREQVARQGRAANELALALDRAELFLDEGRRAEALAALERAELLATEAPAEPARGARLAVVKERLAAEARDQEFLARIQDIRLRVEGQIEVRKSQFTGEATIPAIQEALRRYRGAIGVMAPAQTAAYIRGRPEAVRRDLIGALHECLRVVPPGEARSWLLATLDAADDNAWRVRARMAVYGGDRKALEQLAREVDVREQPPSILLVAASSLSAQDGAARLELLRGIQRAYPADLWANFKLAWELARNGQPAEAIRYYTAVLALRPDHPGIYLNRGCALEDAGEVDAAIADYQQSFALAPQYSEAHNNLGHALLAKGRVDEAISKLREAIRLKKDLPQAHFNLGRAFNAKGRPEEAIAEYREAIRLKKDYPEAHDNLGNILHDKGQWDEAIAEHRASIATRQHFPEAYMAHCNLGRAFATKGRPDEAIAEYREAIRLKKDYPEAHTNLGIILHDKGRLDEAIAEYRAAIRIKPDLREAHYNLGMAFATKGLLDEAIGEYKEAIRIKKDYADAHYSLGLALEGKGLLDEAIAAYREAIRLVPDFAKAHCNLGNALEAKGRPDEAIAEYRAAIATKQDFPEVYKAHYNLGNRLHDKGQLDEAIAEFREAIRINKDYADAHYNLGNALQAKGQLDEAIAAYREAIRIKKDFANAHNNLGVALERQQKWDEAIAEYRQAIALDPKHAKAHRSLGLALERQQKWDEAITANRRAIELDPKDAIAHHNLGAVLNNQGKIDEAIAELRQAIVLDPKVARIHSNLAFVLAAKGQLDEAIAAHGRAIELDPKEVSFRINRGTIYNNLGKYEKARADYEMALKLAPKHVQSHNNLAWLLANCPEVKLRDPRRAVELARKATELVPKEGMYWNTLGVAHYRAGNWKAAIEALDKSMQLRKRGDSFDWFFLAMTHWRLGEKDKARKFFDMAVEWREKNKQALKDNKSQEDELRRFQTEAEEVLELKKK
jgi:tetratricopeptide (TPR) repeat protein